MNHHTSSDFWLAFHLLPKNVQDLAHKNFALLKSNARHPSLQLKKIGDLWSAGLALATGFWVLMQPTEFNGFGLEAMRNMIG